MNIRRIASALAAVVLAGGLITATGQAANADVFPVMGGIYELYIPFFNPGAAKCLDVPHGDPTPGLGLMVFHCHGSDADGANQLWKALSGGVVTRLQNQATGLCLSANLGTSIQVVQEPCFATQADIWSFQPTPNLNTSAGVVNMLSHNCLATENSSGADNTRVVLAPCTFANLTDPARLWVRQNWVLA